MPWDPFDEELWRRLQAGEAEPTVQAEAAYLEKWAKKNGVVRTFADKNPGYLGLARIRERIKKRYNGSEGYKSVRNNLCTARRNARDC